MASTSIALQLRNPKTRLNKNPYFVRLFSSSSKPDPSDSFEDIRKNLSEFRRRSTVPTPGDTPPPPPSFQELYKRNEQYKAAERQNNDESSASAVTKGGNLSLSIRESLKQMQEKNLVQGRGGPSRSPLFPRLTESFGLPSVHPNVRNRNVIGGTETLPFPVFGKEMIKNQSPESAEFVKNHSYAELGVKLRNLRSENAKNEKWFSLAELNERLRKLREIEEKETNSRIGGIMFKDLRDSLVRLQATDDEKAMKSSIQRLDVLGQLGGTPTFMLAPPKEELVEKYFHPDNMSSAGKLKIELKKVRDEFKMSKLDCGSCRVQVAQLTTKIKHLSATLHKKDKHSRKGLQAMVQQRKKLLKYIRITDWDSYCLILSKLGLRDNPDYKH